MVYQSHREDWLADDRAKLREESMLLRRENQELKNGIQVALDLLAQAMKIIKRMEKKRKRRK